jgi:hypothetical protein
MNKWLLCNAIKLMFSYIMATGTRYIRLDDDDGDDSRLVLDQRDMSIHGLLFQSDMSIRVLLFQSDMSIRVLLFQSDMSIHVLLFQWVTTIKIQLSMLV